jgi:PhoH-like ATPase
MPATTTATAIRAMVKPYERLLKTGQVEIEALAFIRGRSIARRFFILDEAQQLTRTR